MGMGGQRHAPAALPPGKTRYPLYSRRSSTLSLTLALDGDGWSTQPPGHFTPGEDQVVIVYEAGWVAGPVWTVAEYLAPTGIRSWDRPARRESLY